MSAFYSPEKCGGCDQSLDSFPFGEEFSPYLAQPLAGKAWVDEGSCCIYLCNSCKGVVESHRTIKLTEVVQYRLKMPLIVKPTETEIRMAEREQWLKNHGEREDIRQETIRLQQELYYQMQMEAAFMQGNYQPRRPTKQERIAELLKASRQNMTDEEFQSRLREILTKQ